MKRSEHYLIICLLLIGVILIQAYDIRWHLGSLYGLTAWVAAVGYAAQCVWGIHLNRHYLMWKMKRLDK